MMPNSATKAGSSIDCDSAVANGSCRNAGSLSTASSPGAAFAGAAGISSLIREDMRAAMPALPNTEPTCRVVL